MAKACANKNSKEWKMLVSQTGETLANLAFLANGEQMPDVKPITEIKKAIKFQPMVENFAGIASRLRKYNQQNGTSHYFTKERAYGNTFKLTLKYNYLPVNIERQRQRMAAQGDPLYAVNDKFDISRTVGWFTSMYPVRLAVDDEIGSSIKCIKESLRQIPNNGIGYGALIGYDINQFPKISFNYLGQFNKEEQRNNVSDTRNIWKDRKSVV